MPFLQQFLSSVTN